MSGNEELAWRTLLPHDDATETGAHLPVLTGALKYYLLSVAVCIYISLIIILYYVDILVSIMLYGRGGTYRQIYTVKQLIIRHIV